MKRAWRKMKRWGGLLTAAAIACGFVTPLSAAPRRDRALEDQLRAHIAELASDAYDGREPGTDGEAKTLRYIGKQWFDIGLESGTNDPSHAWFAPVTLIAREPNGSSAQFIRKGRRIYVPQAEVLVLTSGTRSLIENAPVLFVGKGDGAPSRAELAGRVALLLDGSHDDSTRQNALLKAGATAVLTVLDGERSLQSVTARRKRQGYALADTQTGGDLEAFVTASGLDRALAGAGLTVSGLRAMAAAPGFAPRVIDLNLTLEATTRETRINTHNLIGRLPGRKPSAGAVLLLAHWDGFGECAAPPAQDLICNGAIDNASGIAVLTEAARRLSRLPQMERDVYFLATTGEELGLLGAHAFAENPPLPLGQIVAAFNIDTVALAPPGEPFAVVGKGMTRLDAGIAAVANAQKRKLADGLAANDYVRRQDGWALMQHDVPAVMVSSSWADLARVERFMNGDYHRPGDELKPYIELGGAADDVNFLVALTRWFADPRKVAGPEAAKPVK